MRAKVAAGLELKGPHGRTRKRRGRQGFSTVLGSVIMIAAVSLMGSVMLIWANTNLNSQQKELGDYYEDTSNALKETYVIEDVWLSSIPADNVNITIRNVGPINLEIKSIQIINSTDTFVWTPAASALIETKDAYQADIPYVWDTEPSTLDISIHTERGSIERILWKVN